MTKTTLIRRIVFSTTLGVALSVSAMISGCALLIGGAAAGGAAGAVSSAKHERTESHSAGVYAGTVLANIVYFPAKVLFAGAGAVTSGATYVVTLGNESATDRVWNASVNGDYVVTPAVIEGDRPVEFVGAG